jgi:hypothetical protein
MLTSNLVTNSSGTLTRSLSSLMMLNVFSSTVKTLPILGLPAAPRAVTRTRVPTLLRVFSWEQV